MAKLNLDDLIREGKKVYVKNTSVGPGHIVVNFVEPSSGRIMDFQVPATWIPLCISDRIPVPMIASSTDFRTYLSKGILTLVDPKEAEEKLTQPDAKDEAEKLNISQYSTLSKFASDSKKELQDSFDSKKTAAALTPDQQFINTKVNPRVQAVLLRVENNDLNVRDAISELKRLGDNMKDVDCSYIITTVQDGQLKRFAQERLSEISDEGAENDPEEQISEDQAKLIAGQKKAE